MNQLLTEMDGLESRKNVYVIGATNRPDIIDPAMLRPGRLDKMIYISLPNEKSRIEILKTCAKNLPFDKTVNLVNIAKDKRCYDYSGADIQALVREASLLCYKENFFKKDVMEKEEDIKISGKHFEEALLKVFPSVSEKDKIFFEKFQKELQKIRK